LILALFVIASCLTLAVVEASVSGELDPTFAGGRAVTDFFGGNEAASGTPSIVGASVDQLALWPPNHRMVDVTVSYDIIDNCSGNAGVTASLSVTSNEAVTGTGDGDVDPDWEIVDAHHVRLRAERAGSGAGRVYTITITCVDHHGNSTSKSLTVSVPRGNSLSSDGR